MLASTMKTDTATTTSATLEELPAGPRRDVERKKTAAVGLREGSGAWLQALGAFFVITATWYVDSVSSRDDNYFICAQHCRY